MSEQSSEHTKITIVELGDNSSTTGHAFLHNVEVTMEQYQSMLRDPGQVNTPLLAKLGYPIILVHTTPGRKCIPAAQLIPVSNNEHNNRQATVAASRVSTGLADGCVVGNVYALRRDGKDLTAEEWEVLSDYLDRLMDVYGDEPGAVNARVLQGYKERVAREMLHKRLAQDAQADEADCGQLMKCASCKTALYCSKDCQREHWRAGHKSKCKPAAAPQAAQDEDL